MLEWLLSFAFIHIWAVGYFLMFNSISFRKDFENIDYYHQSLVSQIGFCAFGFLGVYFDMWGSIFTTLPICMLIKNIYKTDDPLLNATVSKWSSMLEIDGLAIQYIDSVVSACETINVKWIWRFIDCTLSVFGCVLEN